MSLSTRLGDDIIATCVRFKQNGGDCNTPEVVIFSGHAYKRAIDDKQIRVGTKVCVVFDRVKACAQRGIPGFYYVDLHLMPKALIIDGFAAVVQQTLPNPTPCTMSDANLLALGSSRITHNTGNLAFLQTLREQSVRIVPTNIFTEINQHGVFEVDMADGAKQLVYSLCVRNCATQSCHLFPVIEWTQGSYSAVHFDAADVIVCVLTHERTQVFLLLPMRASAWKDETQLEARFGIPKVMLDVVVNGEPYDGSIEEHSHMSAQLFDLVFRGLCLAKDLLTTLAIVLGQAEPQMETPPMIRTSNLQPCAFQPVPAAVYQPLRRTVLSLAEITADSLNAAFGVRELHTICTAHRISVFVKGAPKKTGIKKMELCKTLATLSHDEWTNPPNCRESS